MLKELLKGIKEINENLREIRQLLKEIKSEFEKAATFHLGADYRWIDGSRIMGDDSDVVRRKRT